MLKYPRAMKLQKQHLVFVLGAVVLLAAALAVIPSWVGTLIAVRLAASNELAQARQDTGDLLEKLDGQFAADHGEDTDYWDSGALEADLANLLHSYPQILTCFCDGMLCDEKKIRGANKVDALKKLGPDGYSDLENRVEEAIEKFQNSASDVVAGAETIELGGRTYSVVLRQMDERTQDLTGVSVCGFVVDYQLAGMAQDSARKWTQMVWVLASTVSLGLLCLFAVTVVVLLLSLRNARRDAAEKTTFVSNVSHELRTPLTSILSYAEMLLEGRCRTDEMRRKAVDKIIRQGRRLDRMVAELLDFSRLERGTRQYRMEMVDAEEVVRETVEGLRSSFAEHGITVSASGCSRVRVDLDSLHQILENLLTNAAKYAAKDGPVEVALEAGEGVLEIRVADHGPGMTPRQMQNAFKPFWRADNSTTRTTGGYGIGLAVARGHARGMGGDLTVRARKGGGCVFTIELKTGGS